MYKVRRMTARTDPLRDVRVSDVLTFLSVRRHGSLTGAARELAVTPTQVSKAISRLEGQLNRTLLSRSSRGASLSDSAQRLVPHFEAMVAQLRLLHRDEQGGAREVTVAAPSYLIAAFLPALAEALPGSRLRGLQLAPAMIRASASLNVFDIALSVGSEKMSDVWHTDQIGLVRKALFATPALLQRLGAKPSLESLRSVSFVSPVYSFNGQFVPVDDGCPLPYEARQLGHEAQTIGIALDLAARTDQLVFGPVIAARAHLDQGSLVLVPVPGWERLSDSLHLACNVDRVVARVQKNVVTAARRTLQALS